MYLYNYSDSQYIIKNKNNLQKTIELCLLMLALFEGSIIHYRLKVWGYSKIVGCSKEE